MSSCAIQNGLNDQQIWQFMIFPFGDTSKIKIGTHFNHNSQSLFSNFLVQKYASRFNKKTHLMAWSTDEADATILPDIPSPMIFYE